MDEIRKLTLWVYKCPHGKTYNFSSDCPDCARDEIADLRRQLAEKAAESVKVPDYKQALQNILDGNYPQPPRNGKCKHERFSWEECTVCIDDYIESVLAAAPTKETDHG